MSALEKCKNCGKLVSSELYSCIHCEAGRCHICGQLDKGRQASYDEGDKGDRRFACFQCLQDTKSDRLQAPDPFLCEWQCELCRETNLIPGNQVLKFPYRHVRKIIFPPLPNESHYPALCKQLYLNREYAFLTIDDTRNGTSSNFTETKKEYSYPNKAIKEFLGDYCSPQHNFFKCSSCGHNQQIDKLFYPARSKEYGCAYCHLYGRLDTMDGLVREVKGKGCHEVRLIHRRCLKYCDKPTLNSVKVPDLVFNHDVFHGSYGKSENFDYEIWSVERVLQQANLMEEILQRKHKVISLIHSVPEFVYLMFFGAMTAVIITVMNTVWGTIGLFISIVISIVLVLTVSYILLCYHNYF